ncbi:MAG TPA: hypothetical protein VFN30_11825 [Chitinophagaceae bacterium]|nr:hypothetical protein [Chitinophagaceae bacterium]
MKKRNITLMLLFLFGYTALAQQEKVKKFSIGGGLGISYEHYGLTVSPSGGTFFMPRKPWNLVRFDFSPTMTFGKWSVPFNFNFSPMQTSFVTPPTAGKQNFWQFLTNPLNSFGLNPNYKWAEIQLGTQYLKYSELSTGDIGVFGAGVDLKPGKYRLKFFNGVSQRGINSSLTPFVIGAYQRNNWMAQIGMEREKEYEVSFNFARGHDKISSVSALPIGILPQEGFTISMVVNKYFKKGWYYKSEAAQSHYTSNLNTPLDSVGSVKSFKPFIDAHTSTQKDYAAQAAIGKKSANFDIGGRVKYLGAGFQTLGYPFLQPDRFDYTVDTRFNTWKKKINVSASVGRRINNLSNTTTRAKQFIANVNWFTQFNDRWNLNLNYNNFGFQSVGTINNPYGIKNVANDLSINPTYTYTNSKSTHLFSLNYSYSKYDELNPFTGNKTANNTHTVFFTYVPVYFSKSINPDFSIMYFYNKAPLISPPNTFFTTKLLTFSAGMTTPVLKRKGNIKAQLQYTRSKINTFTSDNNIIVVFGADWKLSKKLIWQLNATTNFFKYGNQLAPAYNNPRYWENTLRTGFNYRFK